MGLFKEVRKPVIKPAANAGSDVSSARPVYTPKTPPCAAHCPNGGDPRQWITIIAQHQAYNRTPAEAFEIAWRKITENNPFPAITARVCQHPCRQSCNRKAKDGAVGIHLLERFVGDYAIGHHFMLSKPVIGPNGMRAAIVGAGPAGLSCACHLARRGYAVTVFDAEAKPGGMIRYSVPRNIIPEWVIDAEFGALSVGVEFRCGCTIGREVTVGELQRDYHAVFFAIGLQKTAQLNLRSHGSGAVFMGELPSELPVVRGSEAQEADKRVLNTISPAIAQGRGVANAIEEFLHGRKRDDEVVPPIIKAEQMKLGWYPPAPPQPEGSTHAELGISEAEAIAEAKRCMSCGMCMDCETCWMYCSNNCFVKLPKGEHYKLKLEVCNGCRKCAEACPCGYITMN